MKIKKGDNIMVISGKDRGKTGTVQQILTKDKKLVVTGLNIHKHHLKPSKQNPQGGIMTKPAPMAVENVMIVCPHCGRIVRVAYKVGAGLKERICRKCKGNLDMAVTTKVTENRAKSAAKPKEKNV